jgi:hypothetical protein
MTIATIPQNKCTQLPQVVGLPGRALEQGGTHNNATNTRQKIASCSTNKGQTPGRPLFAGHSRTVLAHWFLKSATRGAEMTVYIALSVKVENYFQPASIAKCPKTARHSLSQKVPSLAVFVCRYFSAPAFGQVIPPIQVDHTSVFGTKTTFAAANIPLRGYVDSNRAGFESDLRSPTRNHSLVEENYGKLPLSFEANEGQSAPQIKFQSRGNGYSLFLTYASAVTAWTKEEVVTAKTGEVGLDGLRSDSSLGERGRSC